MGIAIQPLPSELLVPIFFVCVVGLLFLLRVAISARAESNTVDGFFLGGRNIGGLLSEQAFWGSSFSLANGLAYFGFLGYNFGLSVLWLQIPWCASIVFMAYHSDKYISATDRFTIHGFLGSWFGSWTRSLASIVTITGFLGVLAYEINVSSEIILSAVGAREQPIFHPSIIALSLVGVLMVAIFCEFSGYKGVAKTDLWENRFGLAAVVLLVATIFFFPPSFIQPSTLEGSHVLRSLVDFSSWSPLTTIGILCFSLTLNLVDMSHWQTFSANSAASSSQLKDLRKKIVLSAVWTFFLPGVGGAFFGFLARDFASQSGSINGNDVIAILMNTFQLPLYPFNTYPMNGLLVGFVVFALFCTAFSTAKNYLMAVCQVVWWDILRIHDLERLRNGRLSTEEDKALVRKARPTLYWIGIGAMLAFILIRWWINNDEKVFATQFLIAGAVMSLVPVTIYALFFKRSGPDGTAIEKAIGFSSILLGYAGNLLVFVFGVAFYQGLDTYAWGPIVGLGVSSIIMLPLYLRGRGKKQNARK